MKVYVPALVLQVAKHHRVVTHAPLLYRGTQQMLHFAFEFHPYSDLVAGRVADWRDLVEVINLPLMVLDRPGELERLDLPGIELPE
jgi:hypothetical protein